MNKINERLGELQHLNSWVCQDLPLPQNTRILLKQQFPEWNWLTVLLLSLYRSAVSHARSVTCFVYGCSRGQESTEPQNIDTAHARHNGGRSSGRFCPYLRSPFHVCASVRCIHADMRRDRRAGVRRIGQYTSQRVLRENNQFRKLAYHMLDLKFQQRLLEANFSEIHSLKL
jgi:hypothetical protein